VRERESERASPSPCLRHLRQVPHAYGGIHTCQECGHRDSSSIKQQVVFAERSASLSFYASIHPIPVHTFPQISPSTQEKYTHTHTHTYLLVCVCARARVCVCVCVRIHIYVYMCIACIYDRSADAAAPATSLSLTIDSPVGLYACLQLGGEGRGGGFQPDLIGSAIAAYFSACGVSAEVSP
jgi:hypothetical protein